MSFLDGDPDRPLVTGCVYNGDNPVPYTLPDEQTKTTLKSNSSQGGGGFNEIRFEDAKDSELQVTGDVTIKASGAVTIEAGTSLTVKAGTGLMKARRPDDRIRRRRQPNQPYDVLGGPSGRRKAISE